MWESHKILRLAQDDNFIMLLYFLRDMYFNLVLERKQFEVSMQILNKRITLHSILLPALFIAVLTIPVSTRAASHSIHYADNFSSGTLNRWQLPYPQDWVVRKEGNVHYLHMLRNREPLVPRRPMQFALLKGNYVGSFDFQTRVRREGSSVMIVFNYVDSLHFYYAHLSVDPGVKQPVHNGIFIVNGGPRRRIAGMEATPVLPDKSWHTIRVQRDIQSGSIKVFVDGESTPRFSVIDHTFNCGRVGVGSFDETGDFTDVRLTSKDAGCQPDAANKAQLAGGK